MKREKVKKEKVVVQKPILQYTYPKIDRPLLDPFPRDFFNTLLSKSFQKEENRSKYERVVSDIYFDGGKIPMSSLLSVKDDNVMNALRTFKNILTSWDPKHEQKTYVCALILEDLNENRIS